MAKLNAEAIEIKVSELVSDLSPIALIMDDDLISQLQEVIQQLVGEKRLVEVYKK